MIITIQINDPVRANGLYRAVAEYNRTHDLTLTEEQFVEQIVNQQAANWAAQYSKPILTKYEFLSRFTQEERVAIRVAASHSAQLFDFMHMLDISGEVHLTNPLVVAGIHFLEQVDLIGDGRAVEILAL